MTATKQFIEDAIKGGWNLNGLTGQMNYGWEWKVSGFGREYLECWDDIGNVFPLDVHKMLLYPKAWQAVGKTRGWVRRFVIGEEVDGKKKIHDFSEEWLYQWHRFIDHLADGKTIEDSLSAIK